MLGIKTHQYKRKTIYNLQCTIYKYTNLQSSDKSTTKTFDP